MKSPITAPVLIDEVIRTLKNEIAPQVGKDQKYDMLMCINALEISLRSLSEYAAINKNDTYVDVVSQIRDGQYDNLDDAESKSLLQSLTQENDKELKISIAAKKYQQLRNIDS